MLIDIGNYLFSVLDKFCALPLIKAIKKQSDNIFFIMVHFKILISLVEFAICSHKDVMLKQIESKKFYFIFQIRKMLVEGREKRTKTPTTSLSR
jgi:hypothetical protein